jgi:hypothetical protein
MVSGGVNPKAVDPTIIVREIKPPEVVVVRDMDEFLAKGQPIEASLTDEQVDGVTPIDLLFPGRYTSRETRDQRLAECRKCPRLFKPTRTCRECGCFMGMKTWLAEATCPIHRWEAADPADHGAAG